MNYEHTPSDRVQVRAIGELQSPATCALCGSGNCDEGYVDTGVWVDYFGNVYYCMTCVEQIIGVIGALTIAESKQLTDANNELIIANKQLTTEIEELREYKSRTIDLLTSAIAGSPDFSVLLGDHHEQAGGEGINVPEQPSAGSAAGESVPEESVKVGGPSGTKRPKRLNTPDSGFSV
jgi:hypothetical protein